MDKHIDQERGPPGVRVDLPLKVGSRQDGGGR